MCTSQNPHPKPHTSHTTHMLHTCQGDTCDVHVVHADLIALKGVDVAGPLLGQVAHAQRVVAVVAKRWRKV